MGSALDALGDALGVEPDSRASPGRWFLRLFFRSPRELRPLPHAVTELGRLLHQAFLVESQALPEDERDVGHQLRRGLRQAVRPLTRLKRRYDRSDFQGQSRFLEGLADAVAAVGLPIKVLFMVLVGVLCLFNATTPLDWDQQLLVFLLMFLASLIVRNLPGNLPGVILAVFSVIATSRYVWWRLTQTLDLEHFWDFVFGLGLLAAEVYTWVVMVLGYIQTVWPMQRKPSPLPAELREWPTVDVFIPSYNEPLKVVRPAVFAALGMDWPRDKLNVYLLDDGGRDEFREFAEGAGAHYLRRTERNHAKAGNLNNALKHSSGEYVAIFDCDHVPVRSFLQTTMGWFLRDPKCALVQTPHHFFSPDPFERNLNAQREVPNEGKLFYGLIQEGNDLWNAAFFCGSCAVLRRAPLEEIGGIAVETVTEDAHTALKLHLLGYHSAYLNIIQAAGLATESLSSHISQRIRWAQGMAMIFRMENPLFARGLSIMQRVCYSNAMLHFFNGLPRLVFLTAPLAYLFCGLHVINAGALTILLFVLPHIVQSNLANAQVQGPYRHSFWAGVYESVLAWYITVPALLAWINPKHRKFNVTAKGGLVEKDYFDWGISRPYLIVVGLNFAGVIFGFIRIFSWNSFETGTVMMNMAWSLYNLMVLGTALGVATESRQVRVAHRVSMRLPATLYLPDGRTVRCETEDYSLGGFGLTLPGSVDLPKDTLLKVALNRGGLEIPFPARVVMRRGDRLGLRFENLTPRDELGLVQCTFGRADAWLEEAEGKREKSIFQSFSEVVATSGRGYASLLRNISAAVSARWAQLRGSGALVST